MTQRIRSTLTFALALTAAFAPACSSTNNTPTPTDGATTPDTATTDDGAVPTDGSTPTDNPTPADVPQMMATPVAVTTQQFDPQRTGANRRETRLTPAAVMAGFGRNQDFAPTLDGEVYAQPLYVPRLTVNGAMHDVLYVATQANTVYALDAASGAELWHTNVGASAMRTQQSCGNITTIGIVSTPVIDSASNTLYAVSLVGGASIGFKISALDLASGQQRSGYPAAINPPAVGSSSFDVRATGQRGALSFRDGKVWVPFGGLYGDCGIYHGWVVGIDAATPSTQTAFATPGRGSGIWAVGGMSTDDTGRMFVATGNSTPLGGSTPGSLGEFVLRIGGGASGPTFDDGDMTAQFSPSTARNLDLQDLDIGSVAPVLLPSVAGAPPMLFQSGKDGNMFLLNRDDLGGSTPLFSGRLCAGGVYGSAGTWSNGTDTYVFAPARGAITGCSVRGGVAALRLSVTGGAPSLTAAWCSNTVANPSPPAVSSNGNNDAILWVAGSATSGGSNTLRAYNIADGSEIFSDAPPSVRQWAGITVADGRVFVVGTRTVHQYALR